MPFPALAPRLEAVAVVSSQLVETMKLDSVSAALLQDPQRRADALAPHVKRLKDAGHVTAVAINQMPVSELRANRELVKDQLTAWAGATETLHDQLKAQLGETHPVTVAALEARTEASAVYGKTMMRMAAARLDSRRASRPERPGPWLFDGGVIRRRRPARDNPVLPHARRPIRCAGAQRG